MSFTQFSRCFTLFCFVYNKSLLFLLPAVIYDLCWFLVLRSSRYLKVFLYKKCTISVLCKILVLFISHCRVGLWLIILFNIALLTAFQTAFDWAGLWFLFWLARLFRIPSRIFTLLGCRDWFRCWLALWFWLLRLIIVFLARLFLPLTTWRT